jgi:hypothetical protein
MRIVLRAPDDGPAFTLYREVKALPWWRFWLRQREKAEARDMYRRIMTSNRNTDGLLHR